MPPPQLEHAESRPASASKALHFPHTYGMTDLARILPCGRADPCLGSTPARFLKIDRIGRQAHVRGSRCCAAGAGCNEYAGTSREIYCPIPMRLSRCLSI